MKVWVSMLIIFLSVVGLCVWDGIQTSIVFDNMTEMSEEIYNNLTEGDISNPEIQTKIYEINDYWTEKMDTLCVSISRKDLQPVSDYIQYLYCTIFNNDQDNAITYSRLLSYNVKGLKQYCGINFINLL